MAATLPSSPTGGSVPQPPSPTMHLHPTLTYHTSILPRSIPTPALLDSAVSGAHYSGVESVTERRRSVRAHSMSRDGGALPPSSPQRRQSALPAIPNPLHLAVVDDLKDVRRHFFLFSFAFRGRGSDDGLWT